MLINLNIISTAHFPFLEETMEKITFDTGVKTYQINENGTLRFNPSDPNLYKRFKDLGVKIEKLQAEYNDRSKGMTDGGDAIDLLAEYDQRMKAELSLAFGQDNDFDQIFDGANIMAIAGNGELIITNFLSAITPIVEAGVKTYAKMEAQKAVQEAKRAKQ